MYKRIVFFLLMGLSVGLNAQVPGSYSNVQLLEGTLMYAEGESQQYEKSLGKGYQLVDLIGDPEGHKQGVKFDFGTTVPEGKLYYGLIHPNDGKYPMPVYFKRTAPIRSGSAIVPLQQLRGRYDLSNWEKEGTGHLGYRVVNEKGDLLYDGRLSFTYQQAQFRVLPSIIEGPFIHQLTSTSVVISVKLNRPSVIRLTTNGQTYSSAPTVYHEFKIEGLTPGTTYDYELLEPVQRSFSFQTAPEQGSKTPFVFAYTSDSRNGNGGGERNLYGANYYVMQRMMAYSSAKKAAFLQFTGDMIDGYLTNKHEMNLQYANWKRSLEPYAHYFPVNIGMGNHEALVHYFPGKAGRPGLGIDRFPYATESAEAVFAANFCNPISSLSGEDGSKYDPNPEQVDFPDYSETVYDYQYGNTAVVVLNSNYWYAYHLAKFDQTGGNLHAYIMDNQLEWFRKTVARLEADETVQHVFVTLHTPFFPNGGHVADDMWCNGNNAPRPVIAGKRVEKGIIERRDELLDIIINQSTKVKALLTGDEHNYAKTRITELMPRYPEGWTLPRLTLKRSIYQINNGSAGAPYYAREKTPWWDYVSNFSTQNVVVLVYVDGDQVRVEVRNPFSDELVDQFELNE